MRLRLVGARAAKTSVAWCAIGRLAGAQVAGIGVDPHMVVLTAARPAGEITVLNPHATRAEFSVDLRFGFATTDSAGQLRVELGGEADGQSAADWISAYPSHFSLRPGATRTVRLLAHAPEAIPDGEYWARITVHSRDTASIPLTTDSMEGRTAARINMETATVLPAFYRKGSVSTGVTIGAAEATARGDSIDVHATLTRNGNAAFVGVAHVTIRNAAGGAVATLDRQIAVYKTMRPRWTVIVPDALALAGAWVDLTLSTDRHDVPRNLLLQTTAVSVSVPVRIEEASTQPLL